MATFRGYEPTGKSVYWFGAVSFIFDDKLIGELWILGDLVGLDIVLRSNIRPSPNKIYRHPEFAGFAVLEYAV
ncbi:MAG: hypothetical protein ABSA96_01925 [Candidatus Acidiferrales bacterium]|jgi:hypothetical protein